MDRATPLRTDDRRRPPEARRTDTRRASTTVFLLDHREVIRRGLAAILREAPGLDVVGEAGSASQAVARVPAARPDVAVMDARLPDGDGATVCRVLRSRLPELKVIILTARSDGDEAMVEPILAGASACLLTDVRGEDLVAAVRTVAGGGLLLPSTGTAAVVDHLLREAEAATPLAGLSERQRAVLELIGEGLTNRQIGERMGLAEKTVKNHVTQVLADLGLERRSQAAVLMTKLRREPLPARGHGSGAPPEVGACGPALQPYAAHSTSTTVISATSTVAAPLPGARRTLGDTP